MQDLGWLEVFGQDGDPAEGRAEEMGSFGRRLKRRDPVVQGAGEHSLGACWVVCRACLLMEWLLGTTAGHVLGSWLWLLLVDGVCSLWFGFWTSGDFLWHHQIQVAAGKG